jgi:hypothetical protein
MSYFQYRSNESFEEFVFNVLKTFKKGFVLSKSKSSKYFTDLNVNLNSEYYINSFVTPNAYDIKIVKAQNNYYEFIVQKIPESFNLLFGCELETCMNLDCSTDAYNDFIKSELNFLKNTEIGRFNYMNKFYKWQNMILFHLQINIIPYLTPAFLKRFKYAYIMGYHNHNMRAIYIDLSTGSRIDDEKKVDDYKTLQFAQDVTVKCGDSDPNNNTLSIHCEIISPILNNLSELKLLYDNVISKTCNSSNSSSGFHVNISIVDEHKVPFKFTRSFELELFKNWYKFEEAHYEEYRGEDNDFAQRLGNYVKDNVDVINTFYSKKDDSSLISDEEILSDYGLKELIFMNKSTDKYHSIYKKSESILECRVFPSKNDTAILLDYTKKALDIVKKSMDYYIKNYTKLNKSYNYLLENYKYNSDVFNDYNYSGSIKKYEKLNKFLFLTNGTLEEMFSKIRTTIEVDVVKSTTFLLIFDNVKIVKEQETIEGLIKGTHHYFNGPIKNPIYEIDITYDPNNDFVEIKNYKNLRN